ncbi:amyloid-beta A4 precursor protein-binding family B member 3 isoform X2 [Hemicordylus capensis]|uniref:amyloid-beta A4 precursor protein-binding family B member 3 isoform X2 n=1 Tax=Hemicordylus capensis TaxID=884348 RepID=UPI0023030C8D|nr:amyloid-beta A4 precursor protein-binding family B member 3 isoform X2 [Hemicordylus capensis]
MASCCGENSLETSILKTGKPGNTSRKARIQKKKPDLCVECFQGSRMDFGIISGMIKIWRQILTFPQDGGRSVTPQGPTTGMCPLALLSGNIHPALLAQGPVEKLLYLKWTSLTWHGEEYHQGNTEPGSKCFVVRSLGWVEIPEEDLAPGKSSIAVNNCIQQLSQSKCMNWDPADRWGEGQNMVMILKKDTMSLVDPLDHSLIHSQPIINIRVWGVGCNNGRDRDFAFVASDKDTCMLKCHVFHCNVPAKAIAKALHEMCSKIMAERAVASNSLTRSVTLEPITPEDLSLQVDILDAVQESLQKYEALYIGSLPVSKAMGMDILNNAIEGLMGSRGREQWTPSILSISDSVMQADKTEAEEDDEDEDTCIWECQVRYVTFIGIGKDAHTFALITDMGQQRFQCTAFWCEPDAGTISEAVQAACMVQYQKCLVASTSRMRTKSGPRSILKMKRTVSVDSPVNPFPASGHSLQKNGSGASTRKRGVFSFFEAFRQKHSMLQTPQAK